MEVPDQWVFFAVRFDACILDGRTRFKRMTGTMTDLSWPDEPGTWVGEDGTEYDVVISLEADEVRWRAHCGMDGR